MISCYPTQVGLFRTFRRVVTWAGRLSALRGKPFTPDDYARREMFALVPPGRDYQQPPHGWDRLEYPGDDFQGVKIRYSRSIAPIARSYGL